MFYEVRKTAPLTVDDRRIAARQSRSNTLRDAIDADIMSRLRIRNDRRIRAFPERLCS